MRTGAGTDVTVASKVCPTCGHTFYTQVGLDEHVRSDDHGGFTRRWVGGISPALRETGVRVAALNNSRRRRCDGCGQVSNAPGLGMHQKASGHTGWTEVA